MYDVKMYVYGFTKLEAVTRLCMHVQRMYVMFTHLSTQTLQRENVCMYICMYVITYVYDFTESNATTRYYVFHKLYGKRCMFSVLKVINKIAIMTICMTSTR